MGDHFSANLSACVIDRQAISFVENKGMLRHLLGGAVIFVSLQLFIAPVLV